MNDRITDLHDLFCDIEPEMDHAFSLMSDDDMFDFMVQKIRNYAESYKNLREKIRDKLYDKRLDDGAKWDTWIECYKDLPGSGLWIKIDRPRWDFTQVKYELVCSYIKIEEFEKDMVYATEGSCWITVNVIDKKSDRKRSWYSSNSIGTEDFKRLIKNSYDQTMEDFAKYYKTKFDKVSWLLQNCIMEGIGCKNDKSVLINYDNNDFTVDLKFSVLSSKVKDLPKFVADYLDMEHYKYQIEHEYYTDFVIKGIKYNGEEYIALNFYFEDRDNEVTDYELDPKSLFFGKYNDYNPVNTEPCGGDDKKLIDIVSSEFNEMFVDAE